MSTTARDTTADRIEVVPNEEEGTITFVADLGGNDTEPPTEWITVGTEDLLDLKGNR